MFSLGHCDLTDHARQPFIRFRRANFLCCFNEAFELGLIIRFRRLAHGHD